MPFAFLLSRKAFLFCKSAACGYNAPCLKGMVHFLRLSMDAYGTMETERTAVPFKDFSAGMPYKAAESEFVRFDLHYSCPV